MLLFLLFIFLPLLECSHVPPIKLQQSDATIVSVKRNPVGMSCMASSVLVKDAHTGHPY